ncbi:M24 family metallopeptidase [Rheinheimera riviphila]|uniref:M24 family metallopeptidase n=1 Tax=Rheinheimera riviphila TaxID=1834037 RepID=A0A437QR67_9GAMM|nr:M24 family metallopeptidase [Rheinheimera riviphila]RVU36998.1 M24 family metallopeptidase [Rheinheimera riviphila]
MKVLLLISLLYLPGFAAGAAAVLSEQNQAQLQDQILSQRFSQLLQPLMQRENIDLWLLISREYNEDPVLKTMLPATWLSARRRTMLVIYNPGLGKPLQLHAVARYDVGELFKKTWNVEQQSDQWQALRDLIQSKKPRNIGINQSEFFGHADGMVATELATLKQQLGVDLSKKLVSAEKLAVGWLETRSKLELQQYPNLTQIGHMLIKRAFSNEVVTPGKTTTEDVVWWLRQQSTELGLPVWFHPTVSLQRASSDKFDQITAFSAAKTDNVILPGDLLHVDFGLTYLRLNSDQQQHAYVLRPGETKAPDYLLRALKKGNQLQDILTSNFKTGRSGNELLNISLQQAKKQQLQATIYSHPLGHHGHGAGPTIGMWDAQQGVAGSGDYPLTANTAYSIELNVAVDIPEWGNSIRVMLEEDGYFDGQKFQYFSGRQTELHLIQTP